MAVWMPSIKIDGSKISHEPHEVEQIARTRCCGCRHMSCIPQRGKREPWRFYCELKHRHVEPAKLARKDCPLGRMARRGRPPKPKGGEGG